MSNFYTLDAPTSLEIAPIKKSRFIADIAPIQSEADAQSFISGVQSERSDANHHCWAWRLDPGDGGWRVSDDGEPGGTAGRPILARIDGADLCGVVVVVTRYFGGTKLGKGGLIRAYGGAAGAALAAATIREVQHTQPFVISFAYADQAAIDRLLHAYAITPSDTVFEAEVTYQLAVPVDVLEVFSTTLQDRTSGRVTLKEI